MVAGRLLQIGAPEELATHPATAFVATFTGANVLRGHATGRRGNLTEVVLEGGGVIHSIDEAAGEVDVAVHPSEVTVAVDRPIGGPPANELRAAVVSVVRSGTRVRARIGPLVAELSATEADRLALARGTLVRVSFEPATTRLIARR
jgi:molybdate transport system ATP-binding protein